jgi:hypothetical protein
MDQWALVPLIEKMDVGNLAISDLWAQHNEHRLIFPRLIMLVLALLTDWNIYFEIGTNILLAITIVVFLNLQIKRTEELEVDKNNYSWLIFLISIFVFSIAQWENWSWGWQIQIFLNVLSIVIGFFILTLRTLNTKHLMLAVLMGVIATYSFANGILYWFISFGILLFREMPNKRKFQFSITWLFLSLIIAFSYLHDYKKPSHHPSLSYVLEDPGSFLKYVFAYLGAPVASFSGKWAIIAGIFITLIYILLLIPLFLKQRIIYLPWVGLGLYSILSAAISGVGRAGFGYEQGLASRYVTISNLIWISVIVLFYLARKNIFSKRTILNKKTYEFAISSISIFLILFMQTTNSSANEWKHKNEVINSTRNSLLTGCGPNYYQLFPNKEYITEKRGILEGKKISIFRESDVPIALDPTKSNDSQIGAFIDKVQGELSQFESTIDGCFLLDGWAIDDKEKKPATDIVIITSNKIIAQTRVDLLREDVGKHFGNSALNRSGWRIQIPASKLSLDHENIIQVFAVVQTKSDIRSNKIGEYSMRVVPKVDFNTIHVTEFNIPKTGEAGFIDSHEEKAGQIIVSGWARNPDTGNAANEVIVVGDNQKILSYTKVYKQRPDVEQIYQNKALSSSGWSATVDKNLLSVGSNTLKAYVYDSLTKKAYLINNDFIVQK